MQLENLGRRIDSEKDFADFIINRWKSKSNRTTFTFEYKNGKWSILCFGEPFAHLELRKMSPDLYRIMIVMTDNGKLGYDLSPSNTKKIDSCLQSMMYVAVYRLLVHGYESKKQKEDFSIQVFYDGDIFTLVHGKKFFKESLVTEEFSIDCDGLKYKLVRFIEESIERELIQKIIE